MANNAVNTLNPLQNGAQPVAGETRPELENSPQIPASLPNMTAPQAEGAANQVVPTNGDLKRMSEPEDRDGDGIPDAEKVDVAKEDKRYTVTLNELIDEGGNVNVDLLKDKIENYKKYHKRSDDLPKAFGNLLMLFGLAKTFYGSHHRRMQEETSKLSLMQKPFQSIFNIPSNFANKKFKDKINDRQMDLFYDAIPAFLLNSAHNRYERLNKSLVGKAITAITKPMRLIVDLIMKFFAMFKIAALAIDMVESADPELNTEPNHKKSRIANEIADTGLQFLPMARAITDLNNYFANTKGNLAQLINGVGGTAVNVMRFKDTWNNFIDKLTNKELDESQEERFTFVDKLNSLLVGVIDLNDGTQAKLDNWLSKGLNMLSGFKFDSAPREEKEDMKLQAMSKMFRSISYLGDNRGEGVRDLGTGAARLVQRGINLVLDLPAVSLLAIKNLDLFNKLRKDYDIKEEDLQSIDEGLKLKSVGIATQQLLLNIVKRGIGKMHIEFGGVVKNIENTQWWKKKVDDFQGKLNQSSIPVVGSIFSIFGKFSDNSFKNKTIKELRDNLPDDLVDTSKRAIF